VARLSNLNSPTIVTIVMRVTGPKLLSDKISYGC